MIYEMIYKRKYHFNTVGKKITKTEYINKANLKHNNRYDYTKTEYINAKTKIDVICKEHGIFTQSPQKHINGQGCPKCSGCVKMNTIDFIQKANIKHGNKYDYSKSKYVNGKTKIDIICPTHGTFQQKATNHLQSQGCDKCRIEALKITKDEFLDRLNERFPNHYELISNYESFTDNIELLCLKTNEIIKTTPRNILLVNKCNNCLNKIKEYIKANKTKGKTTKLTQEEFIIKANLKHNNKYDYSKTIYTLNKNKIDIICPIHGSFTTTANHHSRGTGCTKCRESKGEEKIRIFLENNSIINKQEKIFEGSKTGKSYPRFDFYLPNQNICIEFDGRQHYEPIEQWGGIKEFKKVKKRDENKNVFCTENNIKLIRIPYWDYDEIEKILKKELL